MKHHTWHGSQNLPRRETDGGSDRLPQGDPESQLSKREPRLHYGPYSIQKQLQVLGAQGPQHYEHKCCPTWEQQKLFQLQRYWALCQGLQETKNRVSRLSLPWWWSQKGVHATNSTQEAAMSWGNNSSLKEKPRNNSGPFVAVRGMLYNAMKAYFYDMKTSKEKEKGKVN